MKNVLRNLLIGIVALGITLRASAGVIVALEQSPQNINLAGQTTMDLVIGGLVNNALGAFDFDLSYDPSILSALSVSFGNKLDLGTSGSSKFFDVSTPGAIHLDEVSFESIPDLQAAQTGTFTLATLSFKGIGPGVSMIDFSAGSLSEVAGLTTLSFTTVAGQIEVNEPSAVPEATPTAALLLAGFFAFESFRRKLTAHS